MNTKKKSTIRTIQNTTHDDQTLQESSCESLSGLLGEMKVVDTKAKDTQMNAESMSDNNGIRIWYNSLFKDLFDKLKPKKKSLKK